MSETPEPWLRLIEARGELIRVENAMRYLLERLPATLARIDAVIDEHNRQTETDSDNRR